MHFYGVHTDAFNMPAEENPVRSSIIPNNNVFLLIGVSGIGFAQLNPLTVLVDGCSDKTTESG